MHTPFFFIHLCESSISWAVTPIKQLSHLFWKSRARNSLKLFTGSGDQLIINYTGPPTPPPISVSQKQVKERDNLETDGKGF